MPQSFPLFLTALALLCTACSHSEPDKMRSKVCATEFHATDADRDIRAVLPTDAGMHAIWDPHAFTDVCAFETWESKFVENEDVEASIRSGSFVPIYLHSDGAPLIDVRVGRAGAPAALRTPEAPFVRNHSDDYLFVSHGMLAVSGIEYISGTQNTATKTARLAAGRWSVQVVELEAPRTPAGEPAADVPDIVVLINHEASPATRYRESVETFGSLP